MISIVASFRHSSACHLLKIFSKSIKKLSKLWNWTNSNQRPAWSINKCAQTTISIIWLLLREKLNRLMNKCISYHWVFLLMRFWNTTKFTVNYLPIAAKSARNSSFIVCLQNLISYVFSFYLPTKNLGSKTVSTFSDDFSPHVWSDVALDEVKFGLDDLWASLLAFFSAYRYNIATGVA